MREHRLDDGVAQETRAAENATGLGITNPCKPQIEAPVFTGITAAAGGDSGIVDGHLNYPPSGQ